MLTVLRKVATAERLRSMTKAYKPLGLLGAALLTQTIKSACCDPNSYQMRWIAENTQSCKVLGIT